LSQWIICGAFPLPQKANTFFPFLVDTAIREDLAKCIICAINASNESERIVPRPRKKRKLQFDFERALGSQGVIYLSSLLLTVF